MMSLAFVFQDLRFDAYGVSPDCGAVFAARYQLNDPITGLNSTAQSLGLKRGDTIVVARERVRGLRVIESAPDAHLPMLTLLAEVLMPYGRSVTWYSSEDGATDILVLSGVMSGDFRLASELSHLLPKKVHVAKGGTINEALGNAIRLAGLSSRAVTRHALPTIQADRTQWFFGGIRVDLADAHQAIEVMARAWMARLQAQSSVWLMHTIELVFEGGKVLTWTKSYPQGKGAPNDHAQLCDVLYKEVAAAIWPGRLIAMTLSATLGSQGDHDALEDRTMPCMDRLVSQNTQMGKGTTAPTSYLVRQLQRQLGAGRVFYLEATQGMGPRHVASKVSAVEHTTAVQTPRQGADDFPSFLYPEPLPLSTENGCPHYYGPLVLVGPRKRSSDGTCEYVRAQRSDGVSVWLSHDKATDAWFLEGRFD